MLKLGMERPVVQFSGNKGTLDDSENKREGVKGPCVP